MTPVTRLFIRTIITTAMFCFFVAVLSSVRGHEDECVQAIMLCIVGYVVSVLSFFNAYENERSE